MLDSGANKVLLLMVSASDIASVPLELMGKFNIIFYTTIEDAIFKALWDRMSKFIKIIIKNKFKYNIFLIAMQE